MSNARNLANLLGTGTQITTADIADEVFRSNKNIIKNGAMVVAQRATSVTGDTAGGSVKTVDRMNPEMNAAGTWTQSQSTDVPSGQGFVNSFKLDCTTADASLAANDYVAFGHRIEGLDLQRLNYGTSGAKNSVLSFWVKTNKAGKEANPSFLKTGDACLIRFQPTKPLAIEQMDTFPELSRFAIRDMGKTVAAGVCLKIEKK